MRAILDRNGLRVDNAPEDDEARITHNFAPGCMGLVYRAEIPDIGFRIISHPCTSKPHFQHSESLDKSDQEFQYQLKSMKWGLIPYWTKNPPLYSSMLKTINCRDDSLIDNKGLWTTMKNRKRCVVIAQGFFEWLKMENERQPYYIKRRDGGLMLLAGLWDCVKFEGSEEKKLYTYTIITTSSALTPLKFLHDRMPVILDAGTEAIMMWLDPKRNKWSNELQSLLKPFEGGLEFYPVTKEVGKVGTDSASYVVPLDYAAEDAKNKNQNIMNFFGKREKSKEMETPNDDTEINDEIKHFKMDSDHLSKTTTPKKRMKTGDADIHIKKIKTPIKTKKTPQKPNLQGVPSIIDFFNSKNS